MKISKKQLRKLINEYIIETTDFGGFSLGATIQKDSETSAGGKDYSFQDDSVSDEDDEDASLRSVDLGNIKALFVGDSQTYWPGVSYANRILKSSDVSGKNISKNGASLSKISKFLRNGLQSDSYDVITIMGGGNDAYKNQPDFSIYDKMYDIAKQSGALVVAITNPTKQNLPESKIKKHPSNEKLANYVRLNSKPNIIIDANRNYSSKSYFNSDMIHINSKAHKNLASQWKKEVSRHLKNRSSKNT